MSPSPAAGRDFLPALYLPVARQTVHGRQFPIVTERTPALDLDKPFLDGVLDVIHGRAGHRPIRGSHLPVLRPFPEERSIVRYLPVFTRAGVYDDVDVPPEMLDPLNKEEADRLLTGDHP